jgi:hypothetical protein
MSWRDHIKVHPAADLFPMMPEPELRELGEDIKAHGLKSHLKLYKGKLLDGRNRLDAMGLVGVAFDCSGDVAALGCPFDHLDEQVDPYEYVLSVNIHRRHLTEEQRRELIAKIIKAKPEASDRAIAKQVKRDHKTVAKVRKKMESTGEVSPVQKRVGADGKSRAKPKPKSAKPPHPQPEPVEHRATGSAEISVEERKAYYEATDTAAPAPTTEPPAPETSVLTHDNPISAAFWAATEKQRREFVNNNWIAMREYYRAGLLTPEAA